MTEITTLDKDTLAKVLELSVKAWTKQEIVTMLLYMTNGTLPDCTDHTNFSPWSRKILEDNKVRHYHYGPDEYGMW